VLTTIGPTLAEPVTVVGTMITFSHVNDNGFQAISGQPRDLPWDRLFDIP
jgi:hypothetical protein